MVKFKVSDNQIIYCYRSVMAPAITIGGLIVGSLALLSNGDRPLLVLLTIGFSVWAGLIVYDRSEIHFDAMRRQISGWRKTFRGTEQIKICFSDIREIKVEALRGGPTAYRITVLTGAASVPLIRTYRSDQTIIRHGHDVHAWLKRHHVDVLFNDEEV